MPRASVTTTNADSVRADTARVAGPDRLLQAGLGGQALRDRQRPLLVLLIELPAQVPLDHDETGPHGDREDRHHHDDDLGRQALSAQPPDASSHLFLAGRAGCSRSVTTV